jgi:hypothetical protein
MGEMHANHACEMRAWEMHAYERHTCEIAYGGCPPMEDARL